MTIAINDTVIFFDSQLSPAKIVTRNTTAATSHFDLDIQAVVTNSEVNPLMKKKGEFTAAVSIEDADYDLNGLPDMAVAIPVTLGYVNKSDFITFNFTTAIPNYDQFDARRPILSRVRLNAKSDWYEAQGDTLVILSNYLLVIDLSNVE